MKHRKIIIANKKVSY